MTDKVTRRQQLTDLTGADANKDGRLSVPELESSIANLSRYLANSESAHGAEAIESSLQHLRQVLQTVRDNDDAPQAYVHTETLALLSRLGLLERGRALDADRLGDANGRVSKPEIDARARGLVAGGDPAGAAWRTSVLAARNGTTSPARQQENAALKDPPDSAGVSPRRGGS